ncbi:MAG TPA: hypothetical protein VF809_02950, partial [Candidatus Saccharimonadales bacterium]
AHNIDGTLKASAITIPNATSTTPGALHLAGDLGGTSTSPTVPELSQKANDTAVVHKTGDESIAGVKTFSSAPVVPDGSFAQSKITSLTADLTAKESTANKGQANGYAGLDGNSKVPASQMPDLSSSYVPLSTQLARDRRALPAGFDLTTDGLTALLSSGLTMSSNYIAATVGGTNGDAIFPMLSLRKDFRASFRVKATKSTASSRSTVGFTVSSPGVLPTAGNFTFTVGYLAGTGLAFVRDNVGASTTLLADASIVDGTEYDISIWTDKSITGLVATTGAFTVRIRDTSGTDVAANLLSFNLTNFPINNVLVRTNVAAGAITNLQIANHPIAEVGVPSMGEIVYAAGSESFYMHTPANPNGKLIMALHGHGGTPTETGWTSLTYRPSWLAAIAEGFSVVVPRMGGDLWGNDTALNYIVSLYSLLTTLYDFDPGIYLWGNSMGGGAAATLIAKRPIPIRAAYLAQPAVNYEAISLIPAFSTINTAYPIAAERDDNDPLKQTGSSYAGVPMLITSSTSDTSIAKTTNADLLATLASPHTNVVRIAATGNHNDPSHFRAYDMVNFFKTNL